MRDNKLLEEYRRTGSDEAFAQIVARYLNPVFSTCLREVNDRQLAEDLTQAVFLLLARKASTLNPNVALSGWLFNASRLVSRNALREEYRRRTREKKAALMHTESEASQWNAIDGGLNEALAALNARDRLAILLRYFDELSIPEVAQELGITPEAAQMRVRRAVDRLHRILSKQGTVVPTVTLAALLTTKAVKIARAEFGGSLSLRSVAAGSGIAKIVEGAMKQIWLAQLKTAACVAVFAVIGLGAVGAVGNYYHRSAAATMRGVGTGIAPTIRPVVRGSLGPEGTNTYHLAGSKMLDGKTVPWEVWGRRTPYFYYERTGQDVLQDDGNTTTHIYGPDMRWKRDASVAVVGMESDAGHYEYSSTINSDDLTGGVEWQLLTDPPSWRDSMAANLIKPTTRTGDEQVFQFASPFWSSLGTGYSGYSRYSVAVKDNTLREYELHLTTPKGAVDLEKAEVEYGKALPTDVVHPLDTSHLTTYDVRPDVPGSLAAATAPLSALVVDADGNILIEAKPANKPLLESMVQCRASVDVACRNVRGETLSIRYIDMSGKTTPTGSQVILLAPLEPLPIGYRPITIGPSAYVEGAQTRKISAFSLEFIVHVEPPLDHVQPMDNLHPERLVTSSDYVCHVDLPVTVDLQGASSSLDPYVPRLPGDFANGDFHQNLAMFLDKSRSAYYQQQADHARTFWMTEHPYVPANGARDSAQNRTAYAKQHLADISQYQSQSRLRATYWAARAREGVSH